MGSDSDSGSKSTTEQLAELLESSGLNITFDPGRSNNHPCTFCGTTNNCRKLMDIGTYYDGGTITRPVCTMCMPIAEQIQSKQK